MTQPRYLDVRSRRVLAFSSKFQQCAGQSPFAVIEELIAELIMEVDIAFQKASNEAVGKAEVERVESQHSILLDAKDCQMAPTLSPCRHGESDRQTRLAKKLATA